MTERPEDIAQAAEAMANAQSVMVQHVSTGEAMLQAPENLETDLDIVDDTAAAGIGTSSEPPAVSPQPESSPNVTLSESGHP